MAALPAPAPDVTVVTLMLLGAATLPGVPPAVDWLRLKPTPTAELYVASAVTTPAAHRVVGENAGVQPLTLQTGIMQVVGFRLVSDPCEAVTTQCADGDVAVGDSELTGGRR